MVIAQREAALLGAVSRPHPNPTGWKLQRHCLPGTLQIDRPRVAKFLVSIEKWGWSTSAWWWRRRSMARASGRSLGWTWVPVKTAPSGWPSLRSLSARGLSGVDLVVSDAHQGLRGAIAAVFGGASWQRCRTHFMTNLLTRVPRRAQPWVATMVRTIYQQPSPDEVHAQLDRVTDQLQNRFPQVALSTGRGRTRRPGLLQLPTRPLEEDLVQQPTGASQQGDPATHRCGGHLP